MASITLLVLQAFLPLLSLYLTKLIVDAVTAGLAAADKAAVFSQIWPLVLFLGLTVLVSNAIELIFELVNEAHGEVVRDYTFSLLHAKSIAVDLEYYENSQYYDALHRAQQEAHYRPASVLYGLTRLCLNGLSSLGLVGLLVALHPAIALLLVGAMLPGLLVRLRYAGSLYRWQRRQTETERQADYFNWMLIQSEYAKELRLFNLGSLFAERFGRLRRQLRQEKLELARDRAIWQVLSQMSATAAVYGAFGFIAYQAAIGAITLGDLVMYSQAFTALQGTLKGILRSLMQLYADNLFLGNLYEFLDLKPKVVEPNPASPIPQPLRHGIAFEQVSFQYPGSSRIALQDISLTVKPGEVVALVGENGSGKTTTIKLLCRLYDPTSGRITLDKVDLRQFSLGDLRRQITVIFQDYAKYNLSVQDNIWLGNIDAQPAPEAIAAAAHYADAHRAIESLPQGYDTVLGKQFTQGEDLSVGQWQKVAMARTFWRDSPIIVLDEPTSALDPKAEAEVFSQFRQLLARQAAILISHRLSTVKLADRIYVFEQGRIVESGSHSELMTKRGLYAQLFEIQAQHYR
ncbi:MAG: ABC transporter ATP-binding protein [Chloroflexaceae bacterium]|nr:ABC transporter ATP-binding protein [Chloroflexaceae bacterium]